MPKAKRNQVVQLDDLAEPTGRIPIANATSESPCSPPLKRVPRPDPQRTARTDTVELTKPRGSHASQDACRRFLPPIRSLWVSFSFSSRGSAARSRVGKPEIRESPNMTRDAIPLPEGRTQLRWMLSELEAFISACRKITDVRDHLTLRLGGCRLGQRANYGPQPEDRASRREGIASHPAFPRVAPIP